jgi:hypothetical protein
MKIRTVCVCPFAQALLFCWVALGDPLTITNITVTASTEATATKPETKTVTITGTGFDATTKDPQTLKFTLSPSTDAPTTNLIKSTDFKASSTTQATATFQLSKRVTGTIYVTLNNVNRTSNAYPFDTGVVCLESVGKQCLLRWEIDTTSATGSSTQTNNSTTPNIMVKLDYQWHSPNDGNSATDTLFPPGNNTSRSKVARMAIHGILRAGYTQVTTGTKLQPTANSTPTPNSLSSKSTTTSGNADTSSTACSGNASASSSCMAATPQQAFVSELGGTLGWTTKQDGQGTFAEFGFGVRGQFQDLIAINKLVQSGGISYLDLSSANSRNVVGFYEGVLRFKLSSFGHDLPAIADLSSPDKQNKYSNVSHFLVLEAGFQNNSGLQQLATNPRTNTRDRFVGRLSLTPELPNTNHTKALVGFEYSAGFYGGPKIVQVFFGINTNPLKLFTKPKNANTANTN